MKQIRPTSERQRHGILDALSVLTLVGMALAHFPAAAQKAQRADSSALGCRVVEVEVERLPDMSVPRAGHQLFYVDTEEGGELMAAGGHTNGFVPTPTAEYFKDGQWHQLQMVYSHDFGFSVALKSGKVLLGGGCSEPIGIGQTFLAELYDPATHTFDAFGSMQRKRTYGSALELDGGRVVIAGNWYFNDGIELFDGQKSFTYIKDPAVERTHPYIFRTSADDAIIFGTLGTHNERIGLVADRLSGDTLHIPFFDKWKPLETSTCRPADCFIGDEASGLYAYLMAVVDSTGQIALAKVENGDFSLLPTVCPIPMQCSMESIFFGTPVVVDRRAGCAYLMGISGNYAAHPNSPHRWYFVRIDYAQATAEKPAPVTLYYTEALSGVPDCAPVIDAEGNLLLAGGMLGISNFTPSAAAYRVCFGCRTESAESGFALWLAVAGFALVVLALLVYLTLSRRRLTEAVASAANPKQDADTELMNRITKLIHEQKLFQKSDLKVSDIAAQLGTNSRYISDCIKMCQGTSFSQFVNTCRVEYAMQLMRQYPDKKIVEVYLESGFSNETTFFRAFKAQTGLTPSEWKSHPTKP